MLNKAKCSSPDPQAYKVKIFGIGLYGQYFLKLTFWPSTQTGLKTLTSLVTDYCLVCTENCIDSFYPAIWFLLPMWPGKRNH